MILGYSSTLFVDANLGDIIGIFTLSLAATAGVIIILLFCCICCCFKDKDMQRQQEKMIEQLRRAGYTVSRDSHANGERERLLSDEDLSSHRHYNAVTGPYDQYPSTSATRVDTHPPLQQNHDRQMRVDMPPSYADVEHEKQRLRETEGARLTSQYQVFDEPIRTTSASYEPSVSPQQDEQENTTPPPAFGAVD